MATNFMQNGLLDPLMAGQDAVGARQVPAQGKYVPGGSNIDPGAVKGPVLGGRGALPKAMTPTTGSVGAAGQTATGSYGGSVRAGVAPTAAQVKAKTAAKPGQQKAMVQGSPGSGTNFTGTAGQGPATPQQRPAAPQIPAGVNPRDWANPTWRAVWMRQNPNWRPPAAQPANRTSPAQAAGGSMATGGGAPTAQQIAAKGAVPAQKKMIAGSPGAGTNYTSANLGQQANAPGSGTPGTTVSPAQGPLPVQQPGQATGTQTTTAQPAAAQQSQIPPGVNPRDWANPVWRTIWMRQNPNWKPGLVAQKGGVSGQVSPAQGPLPIQQTPGQGTPTTTTPTTTTPTTTTTTGQPSTTPPTGTGQQPLTIPTSFNDMYKGAQTYFDPSKSTVQGQLQGLLDPNNPLMQQAQTKALQAMQASGRQNSSMADTAAQSAMLNAALPIATQDAQTYAALDMMDADYDFKADFLKTQNQFDAMMQQMNLSSQEKQQMTASLSGLFNGVLQQVGSIMKDDKMSAAAMKNAIDNIFGAYKDQIATWSDLFGFDFKWDFGQNASQTSSTGTQTTTTGTTPATTTTSGVPAGVNPRDWANPTWKAIWLQQHPNYQA